MCKTICYLNVSFTQVCRECKNYYRTFKVDINRYYDENGKSCIKTKELYEKFSYICQICGLLNIFNFNELCKEETVFLLRKRAKEMSKGNKKS